MVAVYFIAFSQAPKLTAIPHVGRNSIVFSLLQHNTQLLLPAMFHLKALFTGS
jgi:hypothetical protein